MPDRDPPPSLITALMLGQGLFPDEPAFIPAVPAITGLTRQGGVMGGDG